MADKNKINQIKLPNGHQYEIDAKYWGGYETSDIKTINGVSIFGEGDITLPSALKYCGITTTELEDGSTVNPVIIDGNEHLASTGCVVFYEDKEFVFNANSKWELFGAEATYKVVQYPVYTPDVSGDATAFIDTISQDANGVISVTKKNVKIPTPDWNALSGEEGYIENKPFGFDFNEDENYSDKWENGRIDSDKPFEHSIIVKVCTNTFDSFNSEFEPIWDVLLLEDKEQTYLLEKHNVRFEYFDGEWSISIIDTEDYNTAPPLH